MTGQGAKEQPSREPLSRGDPAPWFNAPALSGSPTYSFNTVAGRHVLMLFFETASAQTAAQSLRLVSKHRELFDDEQACFFGVTTDPQDERAGRIAQQLPGIRFFLDYQRELSAIYGSAGPSRYEAQWLVLDPGLRVLGRFAVEDGEQAIALLRDSLAQSAIESDDWAPVLLVSNVLPTCLCEELIQGYEANGGTQSGFMRDVEGKTQLLVDPSHKRRRDWMIEDQALRSRLVGLLDRRLRVAVQRAFQFRATRIERYVVGCYEAGAGHFRPHRDNTTKGTAHRKFAVTINLNAHEYDGGDLRFPEFGQRTYRAPTGGAIVFSCSLLHEATAVTRGRRFAFLPFLYDEEGARLRKANNPHLAEGLGAYRG